MFPFQQPAAAETEREKRPLTWPERWLWFVIRVSQICLVAWIAMRIPLPVLDNWLAIKDVVIVVTAIMLSGKALYDTLFFDHFWP